MLARAFTIARPFQSTRARRCLSVMSRLDKQQRKRGSFYEMFEAGELEGKLFQGSQVLVKSKNAIAFPKISVQKLDGSNLELPASVQGAPALIIVSYRQYGFNQAKEWLQRLEPGAPDAVPGLKVLKLSIIEHTILRLLFQWLIKSNLRREVPKSLQEDVAVTFRDIANWRDAADILNRCCVYLYLLDGNGRIRWRSTGLPTEEEIKQLKMHSSTLFEEREQPTGKQKGGKQS